MCSCHKLVPGHHNLSCLFACSLSHTHIHSHKHTHTHTHTHTQPSGQTEAPQMVVLRPKGHNVTPVEVCRDQLPVRGFNIYNCNDYMLGERGGVLLVRGVGSCRWEGAESSLSEGWGLTGGKGRSLACLRGGVLLVRVCACVVCMHFV